MKITTIAFDDGGTIPKTYTGDGPDVSPPLTFQEVPDGTQAQVMGTYYR